MVQIALRYEGFPSIKYTGSETGNTPEGFDCSGFIQFVLNEAGILIPVYRMTNKRIRHSKEFFDHFGILVHEEAGQPGDLVFFTRKGIRPTHVGMYLGDKNMIHSPGSKGRFVTITSIEDYIKKNHIRFSKGERPVIYVRNPIGYKRPLLPGSEKNTNALGYETLQI